MLEVYYGSDRKAVIDAVQQATASSQRTSMTIDQHSFTPDLLTELTAARSLFGEVETYVIDTPSSDSDFNKAVMASLGDMAESANNFYLIEGTVLAPVKKKLAKHARGIYEYTAHTPDRFNTFTLADALAKKDKRKLWLLLQEAYLVGLREEEIIGVLWWQLKAIRLAGLTSTATEAGLKDYPYRKAKQATRTFSPEQVTKVSHSLLQVYHRGHKGVVDLRLALEKWVLSL